MAIGFEREDQFILYTMWDELGPKKRSAFGAGPYWACIALLNLCEEEHKQYPVTKWIMHIKYKPAALKFLEVKKAEYQQLEDQETCEQRVKLVFDRVCDTLNYPDYDQLTG